MSESGFRKLLEMPDKIAKEELGDYYIISKNRMDSFVYCLESGAQQLQTNKKELDSLQSENTSLREEVDRCKEKIKIKEEVIQSIVDGYNGIPSTLINNGKDYQYPFSQKVYELTQEVAYEKARADHNEEVVKERIKEVERLKRELDGSTDRGLLRIAEIQRQDEEIVALQAKLSRYESGVEVEGRITSNTGTWNMVLLNNIPMPQELLGKRVRVVVMKEEDK